ncbi:MAG TPA: 2'-5' RNA ligase family protein [Patescibacteria group bacterium]|nr:2'-5' RNA ligase family protein [Patescibacteria group bacterium]
MVERCIMIFPEFNNVDVINGIRDKYDPLVKHVRPHITLVFPFQSNITSNELKIHLENVLASVKPFRVTLQGITPVQSFGNYLYLHVIHGNNEIIEIHKSLYTNLLESIYPQWLRMGSFNPHMTVGKITGEEDFKAAVTDVSGVNDIFDAMVKKISVEIIDENEDSLIEMEIELH